MGEVGGALALILAILAAPQSPPTASSTPAKGEPGPRQPVAGLRSVECGSTIVYASRPDDPHRLQATYAFPDRARWWRSAGTETSARREMLFRFGSTFWSVPEGGGVSVRLAGDALTLANIQLEMRRAVFLWPQGFEWKRDGKQSVVPLAGLGTLTATFADAAAKNPTAFAFTGADGKPGDEYRAVAWRMEKDKPWPTRLELWHDKALVWTETVDSIDTSTRFIDAYFVPPDTRDNSASKPMAVGEVRPTDVPENRSQRVALPKKTTWEAARAEHKRLAAEREPDLKAQGLHLDDRETFEVSDALEPTAVILRLAPCKEPLDPALAKDWPRTPERPALYTFVASLSALAPARLADLRKAAPPDSTCGTPYVRFDPAHLDKGVLVMLPLSSKDEAPPKGH
jgi:hypothetical protein